MGEDMKAEKKQLLCPLPLFDHVRPFLVITPESYPRIRHTLYSLSEKLSYRMEKIPELNNKIVRDGGRGDGWMFLEAFGDEPDACLLNILTLEKVQLPTLLAEEVRKSGEENWTFFIFSHTKNIGYRIIMYDSYSNVISFSPGDICFTKHGLIATEGYISNLTRLKGKIYSLVKQHFMISHSLTLVVCDTLNDPSNFREVGMLEDVDLLGSSRCFLVESCGQILLVQTGVKFYDTTCLENLNLRIYLADFSEMKWTRLKSLGKRAIFLQETGGLSCSTSELQGVKDNCIYFLFDCDRDWNSEYRKHDRHVYVFDLADESVSCFRPCPHLLYERQLLRWMMFPSSIKD